MKFRKAALHRVHRGIISENSVQLEVRLVVPLTPLRTQTHLCMLASSYLPFSIAQELQPTNTFRQKNLKTTDGFQRSISNLLFIVRDQEISAKREVLDEERYQSYQHS
jgi:hypothetical protein